MSDNNRDSLGTALLYGVLARFEYGLLKTENLYRVTAKHRMAWTIGWHIANVLTDRPTRVRKEPTYGA